MLQAAQALQYMHHLKLYKHVHRDIKPLNMLLDEEYRTLKLCDFGTTTIINVREFTDIYGTEVYMAPELFEGKYTNECDVYSWGISLEHCLTRETPFSSCRNNVSFMKCKAEIHYKTQISKNSKIPNFLIYTLIERSTIRKPQLRNSFAYIVKTIDEYLGYFVNPEIENKKTGKFKQNFMKFLIL